MSHVDNTSEILRLLEQAQALKKYRQIDSYFPAEGPFRRELYGRHLDFFRAGADRRERLFLAGNRVGKTNAGAYEMALHLTGQYPDWWPGRRFTHPVVAWCAGDSSKTVRDIVQTALLGPAFDQGTGMIPRDAIIRVTAKTGIADAAESVYVKHVSGGTSELGLKSYDQGRDSFQGTARHIVWCDEESPYDIYVECLLRTMTTQGMVYLTCTPLLGMTDVIRAFIQPEEGSEKWFVQCDWNQVPHLDESAKQALLASIPEYQREARSKGVPQLGAGAIYQVAEKDLVVPDFAIPEYYPRAFGLDVGWNKTAAVWGARDNESGVTYLYSEHYLGHQPATMHAEAIKSRGQWIPGVIDPASQGRTQSDGEQMIELYRRCGLNLSPASNAVEAGIYGVWQLMTSGKLKIFASLGNLLQELRIYQRDTDGKVVKANDHLMDAMRYLFLSGMQRACVAPAHVPSTPEIPWNIPRGDAWMM